MTALADTIRWLEQAPDGALLTAQSVLGLLRNSAPADAIVNQAAQDYTTTSVVSSWQERLWTVPADTRMTAPDVGEALCRPKSWVYRHTSQATGLPRLPHRKLDGELVFVAGEVRDWIRQHEEIVVVTTAVTPIERARRASRA